MSSDPPAMPADVVPASGLPADELSADPVSADAPPFDAVILAGGQARRLGGADKPALTVGGIPLAAAVARAAVTAGAHRVILVGPPRPALTGAVPAPPGGLRTVREDPPGGGPVPALRAGLAEVTAPLVAVLAADLPFLRAAHLRALLQAAAHGGPGAVLTDDGARPQWLTGAWVAAPLRAALSPYQGSSLRALLAPLSPALVTCPPAPGEPPPWLDCDTPADLAAAQAWPAPPPAVDNEVTHPPDRRASS
jgi:molybdopterin-guanine dinucleotide biosynthesis protein A